MLLSPAAPAHADLQYRILGEDVYQGERSATVSGVGYAGTQHLSIRSDARSLRFEADARYTRTAGDENTSGKARFVQMLRPDGSFEDTVDDDPNFLTVLNQPFAVRLDSVTLQDVRELHRPVPFAASSPLQGHTLLRGFLRPAASGPIEGRATVAVRFESEGPMDGALPGRADATVSGRMRMDGTAYYAVDDGLLLALTVTLTIEARLHQRGAPASMPVRIVYRRRIRALGNV
ncbi:MAG: hypothetical protein JO190_02725 [Candidatus Eremiobacteraeota bacterium]|nr:hypothetical protein [Candidatus Eremiobacteraeota bacterium]MBV8497952.1 hypothetical protein [Candidatus Eremiobacteraeota bacterium]